MESVSIIEAVRRGMEDNIYNFTKGGKCSNCGNCCSNFLPMSRKEIKKIRDYIQKNKIHESIHQPPVVNPGYDATCPFRDNTKGICTIYPVRPEICKVFICDSERRAKHNRSLIRQTRDVIAVREEFFG